MTKGQKLVLDLSREAVRTSGKIEVYCGIRFYSDKLVMELVEQGYSIPNAVKKLAYEDYCSLHNKDIDRDKFRL